MSGEGLNTWWRVQVPLANISYLKEKHPSFIVLAFFVVSALVMYWLFGRFVDSRVFPYFYHIPEILLVFGLIFGCLGCIALAAGALSFFRFSSWRSRLPFDMTGWQKLVDFSEFGNEELWRHCKIEILLSEESPDAAAAYQAALMVFSEKANQCYFRAKGAKVDAIVVALGAAIVWAINLRYRQEQSMKVTLPDGTIVDSELVLER